MAQPFHNQPHMQAGSGGNGGNAHASQGSSAVAGKGGDGGGIHVTDSSRTETIDQSNRAVNVGWTSRLLIVGGLLLALVCVGLLLMGVVTIGDLQSLIEAVTR